MVDAALLRPDPDIEVRPARGEDVAALAARLRTEDVAEIVAASGEKPVVALGRGFVESRPCWTVLYKGTPSAMWGVVESERVDFARMGTIWLLGSDDVPLWGKSLSRWSVHWIRELAKDFDVLTCTVDARQVSHLRWLQRIGFEVVRVHEQFGHLGLPFIEMGVTLEDLKD